MEEKTEIWSTRRIQYTVAGHEDGGATHKVREWLLVTDYPQLIAVKEMELQSYNHKEQNSTNNLIEPGSVFFPGTSGEEPNHNLILT